MIILNTKMLQIKKRKIHKNEEEKKWSESYEINKYEEGFVELLSKKNYYLNIYIQIMTKRLKF